MQQSHGMLAHGWCGYYLLHVMMSPGSDIWHHPHCAGPGTGEALSGTKPHRTQNWEEKRSEHSSVLRSGKLVHSQGNVGRTVLDIRVQVGDETGEEGEQSTAQKGLRVALNGGRAQEIQPSRCDLTFLVTAPN